MIGHVPARAAAAAASSVEAFRASLSATAGGFSTVRETLPLDRVDRAQSWASLSSGVVTVPAGEYLVLADVTTDELSGNNRTEFETVLQANDGGKGWTDVPGTVRRHYSRLGAQGAQSASIAVQVVAGGSTELRVQSIRASGTNVGQWPADACSLTIVRLS